MRCRVAAMLVLIGSLTACGGAGGAAQPQESPPSTVIESSPAIATPDDFTVLTASSLTDHLPAAISEAQEVTLDFTTVAKAPGLAMAVEVSGVARWRDAGIDLDLFVTRQGLLDTGAIFSDGQLMLLDGTALLSGRWMEEPGLPVRELDYWVRVAPDEPGVPEEVLVMIDDVAALAAPEHVVALLTATTHLRPLGVERMRLDDVMRYEGTFDVGQLREVVIGEQVRAVLEHFESAGAADLTYEIVVDGDDRLREFHLEHVLDGHEVYISASYSLWGRSHAIEAPVRVFGWAEAVD